MREDVVEGGLGHAGFLAAGMRREGSGVSGRLLAGGVGVRLRGVGFLLITRKKQEHGGILWPATLLLREYEFAVCTSLSPTSQTPDYHDAII
jgi:hypothetical protein